MPKNDTSQLKTICRSGEAYMMGMVNHIQDVRIDSIKHEQKIELLLLQESNLKSNKNKKHLKESGRKSTYTT